MPCARSSSFDEVAASDDPTDQLDGYGSLNRRVGIVVDQFEVIEGEGVDSLHIRIDSHAWQLSWFARQLQLCLIYMIGVEMKVPECMDEIARFQITDLSDHHG